MSSEVLPKAGDPHTAGTTQPWEEGGSSRFSHWRRAPSIGQSKGLDGHGEQQSQERGRKRGA